MHPQTTEDPIRPLEVTVTPAHLAAGQPTSPWKCALALACNEELGDEWCIHPPYAFHYIKGSERRRYPLSQAAHAFVDAFDRLGQTKPGRIVLEAPPAEPRSPDRL